VTSILAGKIGWALMLTVWYVIRYPYARRSRRSAVETNQKRGAEFGRMAVASAGLGVLPALYLWTDLLDFADRTSGWAPVALGGLTACGALVLFLLTHKALGRLWSISLQLKTEHRLVTHGIYESLRHPMYSAFWLMALAQSLLLANWVAGPAGLAGFGFLFFSRIGPEERMMEARFGDEWRSYCVRTKRIIPHLW
jgi:protein-S-isoprenylcysteine O-methyltransferase Ste14